jgi:hypothetical protein
MKVTGNEETRPETWFGHHLDLFLHIIYTIQNAFQQPLPSGLSAMPLDIQYGLDAGQWVRLLVAAAGAL